MAWWEMSWAMLMWWFRRLFRYQLWPEVTSVTANLFGEPTTSLPPLKKLPWQLQDKKSSQQKTRNRSELQPQKSGLHHRAFDQHWRGSVYLFIFFIFVPSISVGIDWRERTHGSRTLGSKDCLFTRLVVAGNRLLQWEMIKHLGSSWQ